MANVVDQYIEKYPREIQTLLRKIRQTILEAAPDGVELVSYGIPTVDLHGKHLVHYAAFKHHIGFFPTPSAIETFQSELSAYKTSKGAIHFPLNQPIPFSLISKITKYRVGQLGNTGTP